MSHPLLELVPDIPHTPLGVTHSPVETPAALAAALGLPALMVKRDDLSGTPSGGNKLRALEFLLPHAGTHPVSMGGYGSTWCATLATMAARCGGRAGLALFPQPWSATVAGMLATTARHGAVHLASSRSTFPLALAQAIRRAREHGPFRWMAPGGAEPAGVLGSVNAALEFVRQVEASGGGPPDVVVVPLGSGGTTAGLWLGFRLAGWDLDLLAVRVTDRWVANQIQVRQLAWRTARMLRRYGCLVPAGRVRLQVRGDQLGAGYGHGTAAAAQACTHFADADIGLDLTYSGKAAASLATLGARYRRPCFWHTFDARLVAPTHPDDPLVRRARSFAEQQWPPPKLT